VSDEEINDNDNGAAESSGAPAATARATPATKAKPAPAAKKPAATVASGPANETSKTSSAAERAWEIRRTRMRRLVRRFIIVVAIPTALAVLYYTLWAGDEYVSETMVNVQVPEKPGDALGEGNFVSNRTADLKLVRHTLLSRASLDSLIAETDWRDHYGNNGDVFSRLGGQGSEETYNYFRNKVSVTVTANTPLRLEVRAFSGEAAAVFAEKLLQIAEKQINKTATRPLDDQLAIARQRAAAAREAVAALPEPAPEPAPEIDGVEPPPAHVAARERLRAAEDIVARLELARAGQKRYFTVISGPTTPDEARYPERIWGIATVFVVAFALMGIFSMLFGAIREHAKV
jgi:capsule polysaccharide export protein KpsE/RkpR